MSIQIDDNLTVKKMFSPFWGDEKGEYWLNWEGSIKKKMDPCCVCGKGIPPNKEAFEAAIIHGGGAFGPPGATGPKLRGLFKVCQDCAKRYKEHFKTLGYSL